MEKRKTQIQAVVNKHSVETEQECKSPKTSFSALRVWGGGCCLQFSVDSGWATERKLDSAVGKPEWLSRARINIWITDTALCNLEGNMLEKIKS